MRKRRLLEILCVLLLVRGDVAVGQNPIELAEASVPTGNKVWGQCEYLLWWVRAGNTPPLVSTGDPNDTFPGALGQPGTRVLFGGGSNALDYKAFSGLRSSVGAWFARSRCGAWNWAALCWSNAR